MEKVKMYRYTAWALRDNINNCLVMNCLPGGKKSIALFTSEQRAKESGMKYDDAVAVNVTVEEIDQNV